MAMATIVGTAGDDKMNGTFSNDVFLGSAGGDAMDGKGGNHNTVNYQSSVENVWVSLLNGSGHGGDAEGDTYKNIQDIIGSKSGDILQGDNGNNIITGGGGNDLFLLTRGNDTITDFNVGCAEFGGDRLVAGEFNVDALIASAVSDGAGGTLMSATSGGPKGGSMTIQLVGVDYHLIDHTYFV